MSLSTALMMIASIAMADAEAGETAFATAVKSDLFQTCPALISGASKLGDPALQTLGYERVPAEVEQEITQPRLGKPQIAERMIGTSLLTLLLYPDHSLCMLTFGGAERVGAYDAIKARIAAEPDLFQPNPADTGIEGGRRFEGYKYRLRGQPSFRLTLGAPIDADDPDRLYSASLGLAKD
jgi:hypothetical protein